MGFGKKTDYQTGRVLDLDKSYKNIIKPAAEAAGLDCKRADEIIHSGLIDVPMYDQLLSADVVVADISTSNANAFYELGVRHALRPHRTITIAEDKMTFPFDVNHIAVSRYQHLGEGIDYEEVERMRSTLTKAITAILDKPDSPIYTLFSDLEPPARRKIAQALAQSAPSATAGAASATNQTLSVLMDQAGSAIDAGEFERATTLLSAVQTMAPRDSYVAQRLALAMYKSEKPDALTALRAAQKILSELDPAASTDTETLGLWAAIHKRLYELTKDASDLDTAIASLEKGFYLKKDEYNGINLAFLYDLRASITSGEEAEADRTLARRIRRRTLDICNALLSQSDSMPPKQRYWILATMAQGYVGLADEKDAERALAAANALNPADWMIRSTNEQIEKLRRLLQQNAERR